MIRRGVVPRAHRGIALVAVAGISVIATVAAMVIISLTLDSTRFEGNLRAQRAADEAIEAAQTAFEEALTVSPTFFYRYVYDAERARVCTADGGIVVQPGAVWPATCGTTWSYTQPDAAGAVRLELDPPSVDEPNLSVRIVARVGSYQTGIDVEYSFDTLARYTLASDDALDLSMLPYTTGGSVDGEVYTNGTVTLPDTAITFGAGAIHARGGYTTHPADAPAAAGATRFYAETADTSRTTRIDDVDEVHTGALEMLGAHGSFATAHEIACPAQPPVLLGGLASHVCLQPGGSLVDASGTLVPVPTDAVSFLLLPSVDGVGTVDVAYSASANQAPVTCVGACDLAAASGAALASGTHAGGTNFWTALGTFPVSVNGLIATNRDTHIGLCGSAFTTPGATCTAYDSDGGITVADNLTVIVGTLLEQADVYISGPVDAADGVSFGVVASGRVLLPYWARTTTATAQVTGSYVALGVGVDGPGVTSVPATVTVANTAPRLVVDGGFVANSIDTTFALYRDVELNGRGRHHLTPPPLFVSASGTWVAVSSRVVNMFEVCGALLCDPY